MTSPQKGHERKGLPQPHSWFPCSPRNHRYRNSPAAKYPGNAPSNNERSVLPVRLAPPMKITLVSVGDIGAYPWVLERRYNHPPVLR